MPNRLAQETSPYLLQHANNPVKWYPWGEEALQKAREENKLILVSIGYAACHWCHVMEHESFEQADVAKIMNDHFVNIKVDREERPDIDKTYMEAVQLMTGRGGWPLNCITLPDGRPIWGGTYFPKEHWMNALKQLAELYKNEPQRAIDSAENLKSYMQDMGKIVRVDLPQPFTRTHLDNLLGEWMSQIDFKFGGRKVNANKFPLPMNNLFLLMTGFLTQNERVESAVEITLEKMAFGGIYDHLGGGFARYSVDPYWKVPHFEKMLYDNGQLVSVYAEAYAHLAYSSRSEEQALPGSARLKNLFRHVVYHTLEFIERELTSPEGGFYSSLDADSEGEEGKFYIWTFDEVEQHLGEDAKLFADYYNIHPFGNWEGKNILFVLETEEEFAERWKLDLKEFTGKMAEGRRKLLEARSNRVRPGLDDKILTSWNALMLKGYIDAYRVFREDSFLRIALRNAHFLHDQLSEQGKLYRNYKEGKRTISAFLDDYAYLIDAYLALYQVTFDIQWLNHAREHIDYTNEHFYDDSSGMYFYTSSQDEAIVKRHTEVQDDVTPASNSVLANALYTLGLLLDNKPYRDRAMQMLHNAKHELLNNPAWHSVWGQLMLKQLFPHYEVVITGPESLDYRMKIENQYYPLKIFAGGESENDVAILKDRMMDRTTIFVCEGNTCQLPVHTIEEAWEQMR